MRKVGARMEKTATMQDMNAIVAPPPFDADRLHPGRLPGRHDRQGAAGQSPRLPAGADGGGFCSYPAFFIAARARASFVSAQGRLHQCAPPARATGSVALHERAPVFVSVPCKLWCRCARLRGQARLR